MPKHKRLGIIGGMGAYAGAWLFNRITELSPADADQDHLEVVVHSNSAIPDRTEAIMFGGASPVEQLLRSVALFNHCELEVMAMACMSAHYFREVVADAFHGRFIDAVEVVMQEIGRKSETLRFNKVGIIASTGLQKSSIFQRELLEWGLEPVLLNEKDQERYFMTPLYKNGGMKSHGVTPELKEEFSQQIHILSGQGAEVIIGACSEIPLLIDTQKVNVPFINAFELLAKQLVQFCVQNN